MPFMCVSARELLDQAQLEWVQTKIEALAKSISEYSSDLSKQSAVSKRLHLCTEPVRQIEDNISFQILPQSSNGHGYEELETKLMSMSLYEFLVLETVATIVGMFNLFGKCVVVMMCYPSVKKPLKGPGKKYQFFILEQWNVLLLQKYGRVCPKIKPVVLQALYRDLTNDLSAPNDFDEAMIDERM